MKITKLGHCCLVIKEGNCTILTDPGAFTTGQNDVTGIDVVLITHEHQDHLHVESLKKVLEHNPNAKVITNGSVKKILDKENIASELVTHGQETSINDVTIAGFGEKHAEIYKTIPPVENTGYFISSRLFYPGDALYNPGQPVDILALPIAGPWLKVSEVIDYARAVNPKKAFPVHDGMLNSFGAFLPRMLGGLLKDVGFMVLELNRETEL
jgi:L-ascorbate metabolism protein UlaG (beta-lactamase superfamily)